MKLAFEIMVKIVEEVMRTYLTLILLIITGLAFAFNTEQCVTNDNIVSIRLTQLRELPDLLVKEPNQTITTQTYALPYQQANVNISKMEWKEYDKRGNYINTSTNIIPGSVYIANSFSFREMNGFTVNIQHQIEEINSIKILEKVEYEIVGNDPIETPQSISPAFENAYKTLADNYDTSYLRNLPLDRPKLLIISHSSISAYIASFIAWKRSLGFDVYVENIQNIGTTAVELRDFVLSHYNQYKCDHLLILGDVSGSYTIQTNIYTSPDGTEHDADDNFYTMLAGNDYFPEMISGRFSFGDLNELLVMISKTIAYERNPSMANTNWFRRSLVVAGNYAEGGLRPVTPVWMSRWLREKMLSKGYTAVDTVFYPPTLTGASAIQASINQGVQYISYRGWGAADGWHYPSFHNVDLNNNLINGARMPIVFSIVCNTGDFANTAQNPCFGEKWMRMGTISSLGGCVGFVGPSDLHTKTNLNNTISSGIFSSILDNGERNIGASVLAGKIELYKTYPLDLGSNGYVSFYYHVYNILSDPSMNMWMLVPETIPASVITNGATFAQSDSYVQIDAPNLNGAIVSGTKNNTDYTYTTVHNGYAILPINPEQNGNLTVTISKDNFVPLVETLTPSMTPTIGVTANSMGSDIINAGQSYQVILSVKNYSTTTLNEIAANLTTSPANHVTIQNPNQIITSLASDAITDITYDITVNADTPADKMVRFDLAFPAQLTHHSFELKTGGAKFTVMNSTGSLAIGSTSTITFSLKNTGTYSIENAMVNVHSLTTAAEVVSEDVSLGNLAVDASGDIQVDIYVLADCYNGRNIPLVFTVSNSQGYTSSCRYAIVAGNPTAADPTGPDSYGYFAYDNYDNAFPLQKPTYQWVEIDPRDGGSGDVHLIMDDGSYTVNLPFTFRYYGIDYNQLTICSNGWVSFVTTWMADFNNLYIPAPLGPYAMVAPYWDDLKGMKTGEDSLGSYFNDMRICNWYDQTNNRYIVEWNDAYSQYTIDLLQNASLEKVQLILYPNTDADGDIVFQYHTVDNPALTSNYSTVGIENHFQDDGLTYSYANQYPITARPLQAGLAVKFTTNPPDNYVANNDLIDNQIPFVLTQNYPNPFNPETTISFSIITKADVSLDVYNLKGQKIKSLHKGVLAKGNHQITWNGTDDNGSSVSSGVFIYKMKAGNLTQTRKMILLK